MQINTLRLGSEVDRLSDCYCESGFTHSVRQPVRPSRKVNVETSKAALLERPPPEGTLEIIIASNPTT